MGLAVPAAVPLAFLMRCNCAGVELMAIVLNQKRLARQGALKALDFATTRYAPACERLINMAGLKVCCMFFTHRTAGGAQPWTALEPMRLQHRVVGPSTPLILDCIVVVQSLFAIFMGRSKLKHRKADSMTVAEEEQRVVSVITNLLTVRLPGCLA